MRFTGHRNVQTVKGCNFFGASDEYVVSGSDCGHVFVWDKATGRLQQLVRMCVWVGDQQGQQEGEYPHTRTRTHTRTHARPHRRCTATRTSSTAWSLTRGSRWCWRRQG
jgi:hypothetical protein